MRPLFLRQQTHPPGPTAITFSGSSVFSDAAQGTLVGTLASTGGVAPYTFTVSNSKFQISGNQVQRSATGVLTAGVAESLNFTCTDANSISTNTATNGQGPSSVSVQAHNTATGITTNPSNISIPATTGGNVVIATLAEVAGSGINVVFSVTGNANLTASGSNLMTVASPSFTAGVNQTYSLHVTDSNGTYNDPSARTLTVQAVSVPTGINQSPGSLTLLSNQAIDTTVATLSAIGGTAPYTYAVLNNANLTVSGSNLNTSHTASFVAGVNQTYNLRVTDTNGQIFTEGAGSRTIIVPTVPSAISIDQSTINASAAAGTIVGTFTTTGGASPLTYTVDTNTKFTIAGASLVRSATGTLTAGVAESVNVTVHDAAGNTYDTNGTQGPFSITVVSASQVTSVTLINYGGSIQAANFVTPIASIGFKKGDIPAGQYPVFKTTGGTTCPLSIGGISTWSDGSMKRASYFIRVPVSVPTGAYPSNTIQINVFNGGSAPTPSARSAADIAAHQYRIDANIMFNAVAGPTGSYICDLNTGLAGSDVKTFMDGDAGIVYRVGQDFTAGTATGGAAHGQIMAWQYVQLLTDSAGNFGGMRWRGRAMQPYADVNSPAKSMRMFSSITFTDNGSLILDPWNVPGKSTSASFVWDSNLAGNSKAVFVASGNTLFVGTNTFQNKSVGLCGFITGNSLPPTTPALPTATPVVICAPSVTKADSLQFNVDMQSVASTANGSFTNGSAGSGTITIYPTICHFGSFFIANTDGTYIFQQAGGSYTADSTVQVIQEKFYLRNSKVIPPYSFDYLTYGHSTAPVPIYLPNGNGTTDPSIGSTGDNSDLGVLPTWAAQYFCNPVRANETITRVNGLCDGHFAMAQHYSANKCIPWISDAAGGSGMTVPTLLNGVPNWNWNGFSNTTHGFTAPPTLNWQTTYPFMTWDHMGNYSTAALLVTGEPEFYDMMIQKANSACGSSLPNINTTTELCPNGNGTSPVRNFIINGTHYYGMMFGYGNNFRRDAWALRDLGYAAAFTGSNSYWNSTLGTYFTKANTMFNGTVAGYVAWQAMQTNAYARDGGLFFWSGASLGAKYMRDYMRTVLCYCGALNEDANAFTMRDYSAKWEAKMFQVNSSKPGYTQNGGFFFGIQHQLVRFGASGATFPGSQYPSSDSQLAIQIPGAYYWTSGSATFTLKVKTSQNPTAYGNYAPANGDTVIFQYNTPSTYNFSPHAYTPGGFTPGTVYTVANVAGSDPYTLTLQIGGVDQVPTDTLSDPLGAGFQGWLQNPSAYGPHASFLGWGMTVYNVQTAMSSLWAALQGCATVDTTYLGETVGTSSASTCNFNFFRRSDGSGLDPAADPKFIMQQWDTTTPFYT